MNTANCDVHMCWIKTDTFQTVNVSPGGLLLIHQPGVVQPKRPFLSKAWEKMSRCVVPSESAGGPPSAGSWGRRRVKSQKCRRGRLIPSLSARSTQIHELLLHLRWPAESAGAEAAGTLQVTDQSNTRRRSSRCSGGLRVRGDLRKAISPHRENTASTLPPATRGFDTSSFLGTATPRGVSTLSCSICARR